MEHKSNYKCRLILLELYHQKEAITDNFHVKITNLKCLTMEINNIKF